MSEIISLSQPTLQLRERNVDDKKLYSELRTLTRDIEKQLLEIAIAVNDLEDRVIALEP